MKTKGIIFDFGFTLFSFENPSVEKYADCFKRGLSKSIETLKEENIFKETDTIIDLFIKAFNKKRSHAFKIQRKTKEEYPTSQVFKNVLDDLIQEGILENENIKTELYDELAEIYHSCEEEEWKPYNETKNTLEALSKIETLKIGLISNHPNHKMIKNLLENNNLRQYFDVIVTSAKFGKRKPNPDIFLHTLKKMGLDTHDAKDCIMVGDEAADAVGAKRVGMQIVIKEREYEFPFETEITTPNLKKIKSLNEILNHIS
ncbi:MAG: HAD family hydrolase [Promethearchaeota archaeon]|jgi:HAD superfamily hydrolase (TIGR01549 family)